MFPVILKNEFFDGIRNAAVYIFPEIFVEAYYNGKKISKSKKDNKNYKFLFTFINNK